jgi:hypothetical protein
MPKWLQGMIAPTLMLWLCVVAFGIASASSPHGGELPTRADLASRLAFPLVMASWSLPMLANEGDDFAMILIRSSSLFGPS